MSYLNSSTLVVDSILTKRGRELFSQGKFNVTKFALSDDDIDYSLYNTSNANGSDHYADAIKSLPILEALPDGTKLLKYKLLTLPKGSTEIPTVSVPSTTITLKSATTRNPGQTEIIVPNTINGLNDVLGYTATISNPDMVTLDVIEKVASTPVASANDHPSYQPGSSVIGKTFKITAEEVQENSVHTTLVITGNETGGSVEIDITITS